MFLAKKELKPYVPKIAITLLNIDLRNKETMVKKHEKLSAFFIYYRLVALKPKIWYSEDVKKNPI